MDDLEFELLTEDAKSKKRIMDAITGKSVYKKWESAMTRAGAKKPDCIRKLSNIYDRECRRMRDANRKEGRRIKSMSPSERAFEAAVVASMTIALGAALGINPGVTGTVGVMSLHKYTNGGYSKLMESSSISSKEKFDPEQERINEYAEYLRVKPMPTGKKAPLLKLKEGFVYPSKLPEFQKAVNEFFNIMDQNTRTIMVSVNEEDQSRVLTSLTSKLYDIIVDKSAEIDFGDIPKTRGDIMMLPNYDKLTECIEIIHQLLINYKQDAAPINTIQEAIENVKARRDNIFKKGYLLNLEMPILTYNTIVLAIISAVSLMISTCIEFIKNPKDESFQISLDKVGLNKSKDHLLFHNLKHFNNICKDKSLDKAMATIMSNSVKQHNLLGTGMTIGGIAAVTAMGVILFNILPILRELTYFFFYSRTRISDYFNLQADLLQMNAENMKDPNVTTQDDKKKVIKRQLSIADRFREIADFFMIESKKAEVATNKEISDNKRKLKADEVLDQLPDSTASSLF